MIQPTLTRLKSPLILLLLALLLAAPPARAQQATPSPTIPPDPPGPLTLSGVQPGSVVNDVDVEIVVTGSGFVDGAVVVLSGFGGLQTTFISRSVLRATLPAGVPPDLYSVRVVNPDAAAAELTAVLSVLPASFPGAEETPDPSRTPEPTPFVRPLLVVQSYGASAPQITPGQNLDFEMTIANAGQAAATNVLVTFSSGDFVPRETGGVRALGTLAPGASSRFWQPLFAAEEIKGKATAVLQVSAAYTDINGQSYENKFELTFPVVPQAAGGEAATATPTPTPTITPTGTPRPRPQLLVTSSETEPAKLQPGNQFLLTITVANAGEAGARNVSMVLGGGSSGSGSGLDGTPEAGGLSGAGGEFTQFAPIGSSNVSRLGDLPAGQNKQAAQQLVVNTTTKAGAYPVKVSFVYTDSGGSSYVDDQVITLLVYQVPQVEMGFYIPPGPFFAGQPGSLPLQLVNTGRSTAVFGNFSAAAPDGSEISNNSVFVGALEPGGFYPLDALIIPAAAGPLELELRASYTDDFNQPATLTQTVTIDVQEGETPPQEGSLEPGLEPEGMGGDGAPGMEGAPESVLQRVWRFILGFFGLSSAPAGSAGELPPEMPPPIEGGP